MYVYVYRGMCLFCVYLQTYVCICHGYHRECAVSLHVNRCITRGYDEGDCVTTKKPSCNKADAHL